MTRQNEAAFYSTASRRKLWLPVADGRSQDQLGLASAAAVVGMSHVLVAMNLPRGGGPFPGLPPAWGDWNLPLPAR